MADVAIEVAETVADVDDAGRKDVVMAHLVKLATILVQLGLLMIVFRQFTLVNAAFMRVALICFSGFVVHHFLPLRFRMHFFLTMSLVGITVVFGPENAAWMIGIGVVLAGICHLPLPFVGRVVILLAVGGMLAGFRGQLLAAPWSEAIWPILGSMFMFRLIVYLYDIRHDGGPISPWRTLSYFFMLPNICFPLFPVIDYKTFQNKYFDADRFLIYQTGVDWMLRGAVHLVLYRYVYYQTTLSPTEVLEPGDLTQFLLTTFMLYLRVSGSFHLAIGMLHLFGFNLPETNRLYLFSSSFNDFWRRINIYWKDFMMKVVYYPAFFRFRKLGTGPAIVLATAFVFFVTWFLHSYQWFWLRGSFPLIWQDAVFWSALALLVMANSLYELRFGRKRTLKVSTRGIGESVILALRILAMLAAICVIWSIWTIENFSEWLSLWGSLGTWSAADTKGLLLVIAVTVLIGITSRFVGSGSMSIGENGSIRRTVVTMVSLAGFALAGVPAFYTTINPELGNIILSVRIDKLNRIDAATMNRNYYQGLTQVNRFNTQLWEVYMKRPNDWLDVKGSGLTKLTGDFLQKAMIPSGTAVLRFGTMRTNQWGLRDKDYAKTPGPDTYRMALLGYSRTMGWAVGDDETYESILEARLNEEGEGKFEILNFAVGGYSAVHQPLRLATALEFAPHAVINVAAYREATRAIWYLAETTQKGIEVPYPELRAFIEEAGVKPSDSETEVIKILTPLKYEILSWTYRNIVEQCRKKGVSPIFVLLGQTYSDPYPDESERAIRIARDAGFAVFDLRDVYEGQDVKEIIFAEWDKHPNAKGHRVIANRLFEEFEEIRRNALKGGAPRLPLR